MTDAELMGARVAVIIGKEYVEKGNLELRLLHKQLIRSVLNDEAKDSVGDIHEVLREKVRKFDVDRLEQLMLTEIQIQDAE